VSRVIRNVFIALGLLLLGIVVIIYTLAPLAWFFELGFSGDEIPIFIDWNSRKTKRPKWQRIGIEIFNAFRWTGLTLMGVKTGYPESFGAQTIHSLLKLIGVVIFMIGIGAMSAVMQVSTETTHINSYNDLKGQVVCTVSGTTPQQFITQNNVGFQIVTSPDLDTMFDKFWGGVCGAVVYDFPALQNAIVEREQNHGDANGVIVGPVFNKESYGIAVSPSLPGALEETLKQSVINLNNDHDRIAILTNKWFSEIEGTTGDDEIKIPVALIVVPCVLGIGILIGAISWLYRNYEEKDENYEFRRREKNDNNYKDDLEELLMEEADNETIYKDDDWLLDKVVVPKVIRTLRVVYSMFLTLVENRKDDVAEIENRHLPKRVGTMAKALHEAGLGRQETAIMEEDQKARHQLDIEVELPRI
jgi:ABC-type amino acid transport substrate-binding protein